MFLITVYLIVTAQLHLTLYPLVIISSPMRITAYFTETMKTSVSCLYPTNTTCLFHNISHSNHKFVPQNIS